MKILVTRTKLIEISFLILLLTMPFGYKVAGRFAISNIGQIVSFLLLIKFMLSERSKKYMAGGFFTIFFMLISSMITALLYGSSIRIQHIVFFAMIYFYFGFLFLESNKKNGNSFIQILVNDFRKSVVIFLIIFSYMAINSIVINKNTFTAYSFDDKSHAVIFLAFYMFLALKLLNGKVRWFVSITYFILALLTGSRLVIIFDVFYILYIYYDVVKKSKYKVNRILFTLFVTLMVMGILFVLSNNKEVFRVLERFQRGNKSSEYSTNAHFLLIYYAVKLKVQNIFNFLFGIGPGNFGDVLSLSGIDISSIKNIDYGAYKKILDGTAPVHSSHFQILLEFSIFGFIMYCKYIIGVFKDIIKKHNFFILCIFIPLIGSITFYSTHNEILLYCIFLFCYIFRNVNNLKDINKNNVI